MEGVGFGVVFRALRTLGNLLRGFGCWGFQGLGTSGFGGLGIFRARLLLEFRGLGIRVQGRRTCGLIGGDAVRTSGWEVLRLGLGNSGFGMGLEGLGLLRGVPVDGYAGLRVKG